jgi:hypothetical protein
MPRLSVPPSTESTSISDKHKNRDTPTPTSETGRNKHSDKAPKAADKGRSRDRPISQTNELVFVVHTDVDENTDDDERDDSQDFEGRQPVF